MNWPQIGSQILSTVIAVGPLGLAAKFYLDWSLKRLDASASERLENLKDALGQRRDSRQALIAQSNYATQKALELEFKAIQDIYEALGELDIALANWLPYNQVVKANETMEEMQERMSRTAQPLGTARDNTLRLITVTKLFYPLSIYEAVEACLQPVTAELFNIIRFRNDDLSESIERAEANRDRFSPLATHARSLLRQRLEELKRLPD